MARKPLRVPVSARDRKELHQLLSGGIQPVRVVLRALALLHLAEGTSSPEVAPFPASVSASAEFPIWAPGEVESSCVLY